MDKHQRDSVREAQATAEVEVGVQYEVLEKDVGTAVHVQGAVQDRDQEADRHHDFKHVDDLSVLNLPCHTIKFLNKLNRRHRCLLA